MSLPTHTTAWKIVWGWVAFMAVLHYDFWYWDSRELWFGFLPVGLGFHALYSLLAATTWALVVKFAWPHHIEEWASRDDSPQAGSDR